MKKYLYLLSAVFSLSFFAQAHAVDITQDTEDPLFIEKLGDSTSRTSLDVGNFFQARELFTYGFSDKFSVSADIRYRDSTENNTDGFSNVGVLGKLRAGSNDTGATDLLFGFGYGGQGVVPNYTDRVYSFGVRTGRQWSGMTAAITAMTNWFFEDNDGIAYIDLTPELYFRTQGNWSLGLGATFRKSTTNIFDQEWANVKLGSIIGYTAWFINFGYEFESHDSRVGGSVTMLF